MIKETITRNLLIYRRSYPLSFLFEVIIHGIVELTLPLLLYYWIFEGAVSESFINSTNSKDYVTFVTLGEASYLLTSITLMNVGRSIISEIREGTVEPLFLSPKPRIYYYLGIYLEQSLRTLVQIFFVFLMGILFGAKISFEQIPAIFLMLLIISVSAFSTALTLSSIMIFSRDTYIVQNTVIYIVGLLSGIFFPREYLPKVLQNIGSFIPLTEALSIFRKVIINGEKLYMFGSELVLIFFLSSLYILIGLLWLRKIEDTIFEKMYS